MEDDSGGDMEGLETWSPSWRLFSLTISYAVMVGIELVMEEGIFCTHSRTSLADRGYMFASDVYIPHYQCIKMKRLSNLKKNKIKEGLWK